MKKLCLTIMFCLSTIVSWGTTIQWGGATVYNFLSPDIYYLSIATPTGESMGTDIQITTTPMYAVINNNLTYYTLAWGALLLATDYGTLIDYDFFANSTDLFFQTYDFFSGARISETNFTIGLYETVFLAFVIGYPVYDELYWYGWVEFGYNGKDVYIVNSALETTGQGIYAGTGIVVPEPSTALLVIMGLAVLGLRRRKVT